MSSRRALTAALKDIPALKALAVVSAVVFAAAGCGGSVSETNEGRSHPTCSTDAECETRLGSGYVCSDGECGLQVGVTLPPDGDGGGRPDFADDAGPLAPESGNASLACVDLATYAERVGTDLYLLLDASEEMAQEVPLSSGSFWDQARSGIGLFLDEPAAEGARIALQYFPNGVAPASCDAPYSEPAVPIGVLPEHGSAILQSLAERIPSGLRPTGPALSGVAELVAMQPDSDREAIIVLVTRGLPNECSPTEVSELANLAWAAAPVHIAVIALGSDLEELDAVVNGIPPEPGGPWHPGDTQGAFFIESGDVADQVRDALVALVRGYRAPPTCSFSVPPYPEGDPLPRFEVGLHSDMAQETESLVEVPLASDCGDAPEAWYIDLATFTVQLCPGACERIPAEDLVFNNCWPAE